MADKNILYIALIASFSFSNNLFSQSLDENFLNSLPKSVQESLASENESEEIDLNKNYNKKPDTRLLNLENALIDIKTDLKQIEEQIVLESNTESDELKVFGINFFDSYQSSFSPTSLPRLISDYILDVGDILSIQIVGKKNEKIRTEILSDGSIFIKGIGTLVIAGMSLDTAINSIKSFISERVLGVEVSISIERLRDMNILLLGNVAKPGIYTLPGGSNILSLINAGGGIDSVGSFRSIIHKRNNEVLQEVDLYEILISGNLVFNHELRNGDSVKVMPATKRVAISGGIANPAIYELKEKENLKQLISFAGGLLNDDISSQEILINLSGDSAKVSSIEDEINLLNGSSVQIPTFSPFTKKIFTVSINGAVNKPGTFSIQPGTKLSTIIELAGGYAENAYPIGGKLYRKSVSELQQEMLDKSYNNLIQYLASSANTSAGLNNNLSLILPQIKAQQPKGRLSAEFMLSKLKADPRLDMILADSDKIEIPYFSSEVYVFGEVQNPIAINFEAEKDIHDYILNAGGYGRFADADRTIVILPNGTSFLAGKNKIFFKDKQNIIPGTIVFVPKEIGKIDGISLTATIAPIISSMAISLASLNSIGD